LLRTALGNLETGVRLTAFNNVRIICLKQFYKQNLLTTKSSELR